MNEISRIIVANNVAKMTALANARLIYSKQIADPLTFRRQFASPTEAFLGIQADYARLLSHFDVSHVVVAAEAFRRMGAQISSTNYTLIQQVTFPALEVAQKLLSGFALTSQMIAQFQSQLYGITQLVDQYVSGALEPLRKLAERAGRTQSVCDAFQAYGLWLAPSMPEELVKKVVDFHSRGVSSGSVHSSVVRYYAKNNWETLDNILNVCDGNANFADQGETIRQALRAHRDGLYAVTIPALLLQVEGVAANYVKANNLLPKVGQQTTKIIVTALKDTHCSLFDMVTYAGVTALLHYIENDMYLSVDFDHEYRRLHREKRMVAHAIRHGRQASYYSRMNSLRLFLMIDVLSLLE